jgi:hypothetical protein
MTINQKNEKKTNPKRTKNERKMNKKRTKTNQNEPNSTPKTAPPNPISNNNYVIFAKSASRRISLDTAAPTLPKKIT